MPRRARAGRELAYWKPRGRKTGCWRKRYTVGGKQHVVYYPDTGETREESYGHALAMWRQKQAELARDALPPQYAPQTLPAGPVSAVPAPPAPLVEPPIQNGQPLTDDIVRAGLRGLLSMPAAQNANQAIGRLRNVLAKLDSVAAGKNWWEDTVLMQAVKYAVGRAAADMEPGAKPQALRVSSRERSLEKLVEGYLAERKLQCDLGEFGLKMYAEHRQKLNTFSAFTIATGASFVEQADSDLLREYRLEQLAKATGDEISRATAKKRLDVVARFYRWLLDNGVIATLPVALQSKEFARITLPEPKPAPFSVAEVQTLFKAATQPTRLFIALGVNCGYRQLDISTLRQEHLDWEGGFIRRQRHKTATPQFSKLWAVTLTLLKAEALPPEKSDLLLVGSDGNPLVREYLTAKGTLSGRDSIKSAFTAAKKAAGMADDKRGFASLRDSGAGEVERLDKSLTEHYLVSVAEGRFFCFGRLRWLEFIGTAEFGGSWWAKDAV